MDEKISIDKLLGLPRPTKKAREQLLKEEFRSRKKQPQSWTKQKYRKAGLYREQAFQNRAKHKITKKDYILDEKEIKDEADVRWLGGIKL